MAKTALITGITGQDGSYLAEFLLEKGYNVVGMLRPNSNNQMPRIDHLKLQIESESIPLTLEYGDLLDSNSLDYLCAKYRPDEVYNLAAQSHVKVSFELPEYTADVNGLGTLRLLEAIKRNNLIDRTKFYQASTSELFGLVKEIPQTEQTPFYPRSPYAVSKLFAYWTAVNYRESYDMFACNGILFNHESPRRGEIFVTRKITIGLARVFHGLQQHIELGNIYSKRDWGHAKDFVRMQWMMLQREEPKDYVISTNQQISVKDFCNICAQKLGIEIKWEGEGLDERAIVVKTNKQSKVERNQVIVRISSKYFRPAEVDTLIGSSEQAERDLNWLPKVKIEELCTEMIESDLLLARFEKMKETLFEI